MPSLPDRHAILLGLGLLATACGGSGPKDPTPAPPPSGTVVLTARKGHAMAYDEARRQLLLFGGNGAEGSSTALANRNSLWSWDGSTWTRLSTAGPEPRTLASLVYDAGRRRTVLFGGQAGEFPNVTLFHDTWEWDGASWTKVSDTGPSGRFHQNLAYDRSRGRVVLYGGFVLTGGGTELGDIWEWNGTTWALAPVTGPANAIAVGSAFDERTSELFLYATPMPGTAVQANVWDGGSLRRSAPADPPCMASQRQVTGLGATGGILYFTDGCGSDQSLAQSWKFSAAGWARLGGTQPPLRINAALAYDRDRNRVVLFGGEVAPGVPDLSDTWEFDGAAWTRKP